MTQKKAWQLNYFNRKTLWGPNFRSSTLKQPNCFGHQHYNNQNIFIRLFLWQLNFFDCHQIVVVCQMMIEFFQFPSSTPPTIEWRLTFFNHQKRCGHVLSFWENKKNLTFAFLFRRPKTFDHHPMVWMCQIATKILWSWSDGGDMWDGEQIFFSCHLTYPHYAMATEFFQSPRKGGLSHVFAKPSMKAFEKDATSQLFMATKNNWLPQSPYGGRLNFFRHHPTHPTIKWWLKCF